MTAFRTVPVAVAALIAGLASAGDLAYDPMTVPAGFAAETLDLAVEDAARDREIPVRIRLPASKSPAAVVLFSHGLGGSKENGEYLARHWAARGYLVVAMQHPGSDAAVWRDVPLGRRRAAMQEAASTKNFRLRAEDVRAVLDQLEAWNVAEGHPLFGRLDLTRVGMSGHSFGAVTTQAVAGQTFLVGGQALTDDRIQAAIAFSPSAPVAGDPSRAFGAVRIPWLLMTGTHDDSPIGQVDAASRLTVFPALPPGEKYELVLDGAEHSAFSDRELSRQTRNPNHHRAILAISAAFWDAWLRDDPEARAWLDGDGPADVLEKRDRWQRK